MALMDDLVRALLERDNEIADLKRALDRANGIANTPPVDDRPIIIRSKRNGAKLTPKSAKRWNPSHCVKPGCKNPSKGPGASYLCDTHRAKFQGRPEAKAWAKAARKATS